MQQLVGAGVAADQIDRCPDHVPPRRGDDGVGLGVHAAAELVALAGGNLQRLPRADPQIAAVAPPAGRPVVAGGDDLIVAHNDRAVLAPQTGGPLKNGVGNVQIVVLLAGAGIHASSLLFRLPALKTGGWAYYTHSGIGRQESGGENLPKSIEILKRVWYSIISVWVEGGTDTVTEKELHRLSRQDLLQLLLAQSKEVSRQKNVIEEMKTNAAQDLELTERLKGKLDEKDETFDRLKEKLDEKDETFDRLKERLDEKDATIERLKAKLDEKDATIEHLKHRLDAKDETMNKLKADHEDMAGTVEFLRSRLDEKDAALDAARARLDQLSGIAVPGRKDET